MGQLQRADGPARRQKTWSRTEGGFRGNGQDLAYITVTVTDKVGVGGPASQPFRMILQELGEIVATDNGDATSLPSRFSHRSRNAFQRHDGRAMVPQQSGPARNGADHREIREKQDADVKVQSRNEWVADIWTRLALEPFRHNQPMITAPAGPRVSICDLTNHICSSRTQYGSRSRRLVHTAQN